MANKNSAPGKRKNVFIDLKTEPALKALKKSEIINEYELLKGTLSHDKNFKYVEDFTPLNTAS